MVTIKALLKADTGNYLSRCHHCVPNAAYPDTATVHITEAQLASSPYAQWEVTRLSK